MRLESRSAIAAGVVGSVVGVLLSALVSEAGAGGAAAAVVSGVSVAAEGTKGFPDEWFFMNDAKQREGSLTALEGKPMPAWTVESWIGGEVTPASCRGKVVVVDFWATWCGPCVRAIPENVEMVKRYGDRGLVFVGLHDSGDGWQTAADVVRSKGINYPVGLDAKGGPSATAFGLKFFPTYVVIDKRGIVRAAGLLPNRVEDVVKVLLEEADLSDSERAEKEFGADFYYGGAMAPAAMRAREGATIASMEGLETRLEGRPGEADWLGAPVSAAERQGKPMVICFVSPHSISMKEAAALNGLSESLKGEGIVFMGVCDSRANWEAMTKLHAERKLSMPVVRDLSEGSGEGTSAAAKGEIARSLGIEFFPATVIVDGEGKIRCAGVRADKVKVVLEKVVGRPLGASGGASAAGVTGAGASGEAVVETGAAPTP